MMIVKRFILGEYSTNTYLVISGDEGILIDVAENPSEVIDYILTNNIKLKSIYATHGHFDHVLGVTEVKKYFNVPFFLHRSDLHLLRRDERTKGIVPDGFIDEKSIIKIGNEELKVIETPGHTMGSVCYIFDDGIFTGDTLFNGSIGRYDLGGDKNLLKKSLNKLMELNDGLTVYPGHGFFTTLGYEKLTNPFLNGEFEW
ncbi:MBL fold metallo-hydrolase [Sulfurisphaera ohwakuensis]|uniref:MBL fold metallo-hydrolase n=2 Tax=Sulfurisphaera ohwakuensis TaxID=69656 RepID=A0A650CIG6_SULOH|nr:MBL fold metallo-hydrolase [Sulfurisphaera ohwakuensis]